MRYNNYKHDTYKANPRTKKALSEKRLADKMLCYIFTLKLPLKLKLLFWNIGPSPTFVQLAFVNSAITGIDADVVCISEGTPSMIACADLVTAIEGLGYLTYYHPNLSTAAVIGSQYNYNKLGLKLFYKNTLTGNKIFTFADQQAEGRILHFRFQFGAQHYSCFFIHNMSKGSDEISQQDFLFKLKLCIDSKRLLHKHDKFFIYGDFNLEPWDPLLRHKRTVKSYFYKKEHSFYNSSNAKNLYFNPFLEYIKAHGNDLMIGTFHDESYSSLLDFALFSEGMNNFDVEILDSINGAAMLRSVGTKIAIHNDFDHLPILITLK